MFAKMNVLYLLDRMYYTTLPLSHSPTADLLPDLVRYFHRNLGAALLGLRFTCFLMVTITMCRPAGVLGCLHWHFVAVVNRNFGTMLLLITK